MQLESDSLNAILQEISQKHGVALSQDDPILMVHTILYKLLEEATSIQEQNLEDLKDEVEAVTEKWKLETKEKADKVINEALRSAKVVISRELETFKSELQSANAQAAEKYQNQQDNQLRMLKLSCIINFIFVLIIVFVAFFKF